MKPLMICLFYVILTNIFSAISDMTKVPTWSYHIKKKQLAYLLIIIKKWKHLLWLCFIIETWVDVCISDILNELHKTMTHVTTDGFLNAVKCNLTELNNKEHLHSFVVSSVCKVAIKRTSSLTVNLLMSQLRSVTVNF